MKGKTWPDNLKYVEKTNDFRSTQDALATSLLLTYSVCRSAAWVTSGNLPDMQNLRPYLGPTESESDFNKIPQLCTHLV